MRAYLFERRDFRVHITIYDIDCGQEGGVRFRMIFQGTESGTRRDFLVESFRHNNFNPSIRILCFNSNMSYTLIYLIV